MLRSQRILVFSCLIVLSQTQVLQQRNNQNKKLNVLVLYESLCPDSIRFLSRELGPNYDDLKDYIDVQLVPFGKSYSEENGSKFYCQHGPDECDGNKKQSCVLSQTSNQSAQVKFVVCAMTQPAHFLKACAETAGLNGNIDKCLNSQQGTKLQLQAEKITKHYRPSFVPTIIYENVFDQELQDSSIRNFRGTVCRLLQSADGIDGLNEHNTRSPCG